jgi:diguanylate cyclase (GGDEF)-like protein
MQELLERKKGLYRTILIVDDEMIEREILGAMLSDQYHILYAENGASALGIINKEKMKLSLVISDLHMPELDGYSLLKIIRSDAELRRIPVIMLTSEKCAEVESLQLGASDFISKPYEAPDVVRARVMHSIELAEDSVIIHETERDELTGLFNKEFFFQYGKRLDLQNEKMLMDALVIDINRFHLVNELYGREYGDLVLKKIGNTIHNIVKQNGGLACRSNSDTFCIYIPHNAELKKKLPYYVAVINRNLEGRKISVRMGIYFDDGSGLRIEQKFDRAFLACRKLRDSYSTCFNFYNEELHNKEIHSERLINDMDKALSEKQFKVLYQPKYSVAGNKPKLTSAEALTRWYHPEFGVVYPKDFISLFENNGLIHKLDHYVWSKAAAQIKKWKDKFGYYVPVSVNVSRIDIFNPKLGRMLSDITRSNGIENDKLLLEITESAYTDDLLQIISTVMGLRSQGFKIEMDDFGSGYSSLNMLTSLPIDALKLDMEFIRNICESKKDCRLVSIMIDIARLLDVPVIAEGVETKDQMELLKEVGCDIIQGYYFSKPLTPEEFEKLITEEYMEG